jgi:hypothetical protein
VKWLRWLLPIAALVTLICVVIWHDLIVHWLTVHTGSSNTSGAPPNYNFWSGFGSDLGEVALFGAIIGGWRKINCEVKGCPRIGRHKTAAGHSVCRHHHPEGAPTHSDVIRAHHGAKAARLNLQARHETLQPPASEG